MWIHTHTPSGQVHMLAVLTQEDGIEKLTHVNRSKTYYTVYFLSNIIRYQKQEH